MLLLFWTALLLTGPLVSPGGPWMNQNTLLSTLSVLNLNIKGHLWFPRDLFMEAGAITGSFGGALCRFTELLTPSDVKRHIKRPLTDLMIKPAQGVELVFF